MLIGFKDGEVIVNDTHIEAIRITKEPRSDKWRITAVLHYDNEDRESYHLYVSNDKEEVESHFKKLKEYVDSHTNIHLHEVE